MTPGRRVTAAAGAAGVQLRIEIARPFDGTLLGLDDSEAAELRARAGDDAALERTRERRVLRHQRLGQKVVEALLRDAREDEVLVEAYPTPPSP